MKRPLALFLGLAAGTAIACTTVEGVAFDVNVGAVSPQSIADDIGTRLQQALGARFGTGVHVQGIVRYSVDLPFGLSGGLHSIPFIKACGKTFEDSANEYWTSAGDGTGGVGAFCSVQGGFTTGIVGYTPIYGRATVCSLGECSSTTYVKSYEPVYGMVRTDSQIGLDC